MQVLVPSKYPPKAEFSQWVLIERVSNPQFVLRISFTDKAAFIRSGITYNKHVQYLWADTKLEVLDSTVKSSDKYSKVLVTKLKNTF